MKKVDSGTGKEKGGA